MTDFLYSIDVYIFFFFNGTVHNPVFDLLMPFLTNFNNWRIPVILIILFLGIKYKKRGLIAVACGIIGVTVSDQLTSTILKPLIGRTRPCFELENVRLLVDQVRSLSFPSSHAANISVTAVVFSYFFPRAKIYLVILAVSVSFSRIYVGVHYPSDVIVGAGIGVLAGMLVIELYKISSKRFGKLEVNGY
ncbi:phosphatase PAP2 family protein [candidate division KSB1 bacterium]